MTELKILSELIFNTGISESKIQCDMAAKQLLANGVIVPPCKAGDEVWFLYRLTEKYGGTRICKAKVVDLHYFTIDQLWWLRIVYDDINGHKDVTTALFGKLVFLTKEEAEQALKGAEGK